MPEASNVVVAIESGHVKALFGEIFDSDKAHNAWWHQYQLSHWGAVNTYRGLSRPPLRAVLPFLGLRLIFVSVHDNRRAHIYMTKMISADSHKLIKVVSTAETPGQFTASG
jgi:hypothetical protein